jgi:hypothetical protein
VEKVLKFLYVFCGLVLLVMFSRWLDEGKDNTAACESAAQSVYQERLTEAISDPTVWQVNGNSSAQEYAKRSAAVVRSFCKK